MLYCIQVEPSTETKTEAEIRAIVPGEYYSAVFHLTRRMHRKYHGAWRDVVERFLPSYIFIESDRIDMLYQELKRVPALTKVVGTREWQVDNGFDGFEPLSPEEEDFIRRLAMGQGAASPGMVDISHIEILEGKRVLVVDGPLLGLEGRIRKVDLHKRQAIVEAQLLGRTMEIRLGVEMVERL